MYLKKLGLVNFKNYSNAELEFCPKINCFVGGNGVGKTNLLDAIHYLSLCKSYFNYSDAESILYGAGFAVIQGEFNLKNKTEEIYCALQQDKRKVFKRNKKEYSRLSDHIGLLPLVMISPMDSVLILDGGEERRKFINNVIVQYDRQYLEMIIRINRLIAQRNKLLKDIADKGTGHETLDVYDFQLAEAGEIVFQKRREFAERLVPVFQDYYDFISGRSEKVELLYQSQLADGDYHQHLIENRGKDLFMGYTTSGPHKDDLVLNLFGHNIRKAGSQGQQKTFLVALKFAQFEFIREVSGKLPVLLLDDVFDKFDENRVKQIINLVSEQKFGQIFITHTNTARMKAVLENINVEHRLFHVSDGKIDMI
ncbi:MAG: DNA replication/repair protein RecF [Bacteroidales bacterium]|nr:DNA replication/repair protein RecF [Bacteroidales bacterium]